MGSMSTVTGEKPQWPPLAAHFAIRLPSLWHNCHNAGNYAGWLYCDLGISGTHQLESFMRPSKNRASSCVPIFGADRADQRRA
jgi:hypothetical protein